MPIASAAEKSPIDISKPAIQEVRSFHFTAEKFMYTKYRVVISAFDKPVSK